MRKKVLLLSQYFYPEIGSAGNRLKNIFELLDQENYDVHILTTEPTYPNKKIYQNDEFWNNERLNQKDSQIHRISVANRKYSRSIFNRLLYFLEIAFKMIMFIFKDRNKYDVIFVSSPPIFVGMVGLFAKWKYKSRMILDIRDLWPESLKGVGVLNYKFILRLFYLIEKILYKRANHIIVNSTGFVDYIVNKQGIKREKISFMPNSARLNEIATKSTNETDEFKVIYTGNLGLAQDIDILKELAKKLNDYQIKLSILGYGMKKEELRQFIKDEKLKNVHFYTPVTRSECFKINKQHQVGLVSLNGSQVFETVLPGKVIDYMTCKIPVVAAVSGYSKEIIESEKVGLVSESRSVDEVVKYILYLKNNRDVLLEMANNSEQFIRQNFLWEENIKTLISHIEENVSDYKGSYAPKTKTSKVETL